MRIPRIYYPQNIKSNSLIDLSLASSNHLKVMKLKEGHQVEIFNGRGCVISGEIQNIKKNFISIKLSGIIEKDNSPTFKVNLGVSHIKNFDKIVKDSSQLGVNSLTSFICDRTKLRDFKKEKFHRWGLISASSCEQSGLNWIPKISQMQLKDWIETSDFESKFYLDPKAELSMKDIKITPSIDIGIGPEGGFTELEEELFEENGFIGINCGDLIIKTESMPIVVLSMLKILKEVS